MSMAMSQSAVMQQASLAVTKKAMDVAEVQMQGLVDMMKGVPSFGHQLDIRV